MAEQTVPKKLDRPTMLKRRTGMSRPPSILEEHSLVLEEKGYAFAGGPFEVLAIVQEALDTRDRAKEESERVYR